ncbi:sensor histidine kinase [Paenibacillus aurantiacus]|uniref:Signal transduction histidine-protein kinase ArlS n=1 Tax=Paenibacillus aurantiacus TaxID=1936118 RepID=A0ABV5KTT7_9BACL
MKLKNKIMILTASLVIGILICIDISVYGLFIRSATQSETESLQTKAEQIIEKVGADRLIQGGQHQLLRLLLPEDTMIRVVNSDKQVIESVVSEEAFDLPTIKLSTQIESQLMEDNETSLLVVRMPIRSGSQQVGMFEIAEKLESLDTNLNLLITLLTVTTIGGIILSFIGGSLLSRAIIKPISKSIQTMKEIEESLVFKRIPLQGSVHNEMAQMTITFNRLMDRLEESFASQQRFISDASHELNTTLTIVEGYANMLRRWGGKDETVQRESIETIYEETRRMRFMTQQLLDLAASQNSHVREAEAFDMVNICKQSIALEKDVHKREIKLELEGSSSSMIGDPYKIKQLLIILIDNALKYSNDEVRVKAKFEPKQIRIHVIDKGIGIPRKEINLVFERFYRVDLARQRKTGGTGLGLAIAKEIVIEHGGTIQIDSDEGVGTEVIITMPRNFMEKIPNVSR